MNVKLLGSGPIYNAGARHLDSFVNIKDQAEILILLSHPKILTKAEIEKYKYVINFHAGLPWYRGRHALQWMLIDGVERIPMSVHYVDEGIDTGNILVHEYLRPGLNETYGEVLGRICAYVGPMLLRALRCLGDPGVKQESGRYTRRRTIEDSRVELKLPSLEAHRFINAMADPMPNANWNGVTYKRSVIENGEQVVTCAYRIST